MHNNKYEFNKNSNENLQFVYTRKRFQSINSSLTTPQKIIEILSFLFIELYGSTFLMSKIPIIQRILSVRRERRVHTGISS